MAPSPGSLGGLRRHSRPGLTRIPGRTFLTQQWRPRREAHGPERVRRTVAALWPDRWDLTAIEQHPGRPFAPAHGCGALSQNPIQSRWGARQLLGPRPELPIQSPASIPMGDPPKTERQRQGDRPWGCGARCHLPPHSPTSSAATPPMAEWLPRPRPAPGRASRRLSLAAVASRPVPGWPIRAGGVCGDR